MPSPEGQQLRYCGVGVGYDDIYIQGNPADLKFIAYYIQGGQVTAVARQAPLPGHFHFRGTLSHDRL